jgi:guanylate kinase
MERRLLRKGILFVLIGPTGSGKTTICSRLIAEFPTDLHYSVSVTSREPRPQEVPGESYHFMSRKEFEERRERGEFFEWEEIHGNLYGTLKANLVAGIDAGKDLLFQIDVKGAVSFKQAFPDNTVTIFIVPPSFLALKERLFNRGTVDPHEVRRRFTTTRDEYAALLGLTGKLGPIDYLIVNHELDQAYDQIRGVVLAERCRFHRIDAASVERICELETLDKEMM